MTDTLDIDDLLQNDKVRTIVCCGSGGVGKTTTSAAIAVRAAEQGRRVAVLTIDPAKRLAQAIGLEHLDNEPERVPTVDESAGGSLDAMMLDMKRTFDEVVVRHAAPEKVQQILDNPFYQAVSSSFAGTQEYMAMERLGQLMGETDESGKPRWDLVVVDTPPSRSALDFLDAPQRLGTFLDGKFIRLMTAPARAGGRAYFKVVSVGISSVSAVMSKVLGAQLLSDAQTFIAALETMFGGFRERADQTYALLKDPSTRFVVVATPDRDALREAAYFVDRLEEDGMPLAGMVVNRVQMTYVPSVNASRARNAADAVGQLLDRTSGWRPKDTEALLRLHAEVTDLGVRHAEAIERFRVLHPKVSIAQVAAAGHDVNDISELRDVAEQLTA